MCGIAGVTGVEGAAVLTMEGLHGVQNRAEEFAGITSTDGFNMYRHAGPGAARDVFTQKRLSYLHGASALGHVRYATSGEGEANRDNTQPILGNWKGMKFALAHNGNLTNTAPLARRFPNRATTMDSEFIVRLIEAGAARGGEAKNIEWAVEAALKQLEGSFALGILLEDGRLIAALCKEENHPLCVGRVGEGWAIASETTGLTAMGATYTQEVEPGTMLVLSPGKKELKPRRFAPVQKKKCAFEFAYLSMPTSHPFGHSVSTFRRSVGKALEEHCPVVGGADIVVGIPDSANLYAEGYGKSSRSGVYDPAVILRHHGAGRNFLLGTQEHRNNDIKAKHLYDAQRIEGRRIVIVDDSIVRGTTLQWLTGKLRELGALEVHIRIATPPIHHPCLYGVNTKTHDELVANRMEKEELRLFLRADSLEFLPIDAFQNLLPVAPGEDAKNSHCFACWNGQYWHKTAW